MRPLRLIPHKTQIRFIAWRRVCFAASLAAVVLSLGLFGEYALSERTRLFGEVAREVEREDDDRRDLRMS